MNKNRNQTVRIYSETLERIRRLAVLRNTTVPRMIDEMSIDYEMDLRSIAENKLGRIQKDSESKPDLYAETK